jgi:hypothetical protein
MTALDGDDGSPTIEMTPERPAPSTPSAPSAASAPSAGSVDMLAVASVALSGVGFLTLLRLADRRERAPITALSLFFATTLESLAGTTLGLVAARRASDTPGPSKGMLLGAAGAVLGIITTILNFNWMRIRRRL